MTNHSLFSLFPQGKFIAWDWDYTLSYDGLHIKDDIINLIKKLNDKGIQQIILSGRHPGDIQIQVPEELSTILTTIITIDSIPASIRRVDKFNPLRFKLWILRIVNSRLICYVDNDKDTIRALLRIGIRSMPTPFVWNFLFGEEQTIVRKPYRRKLLNNKRGIH